MDPKTDVFFDPNKVGMESNTEHGTPTEADIDVIADLPAEHAEVFWSQKIGQANHVCCEGQISYGCLPSVLSPDSPASHWRGPGSRLVMIVPQSFHHKYLCHCDENLRGQESYKLV